MHTLSLGRELLYFVRTYVPDYGALLPSNIEFGCDIRKGILSRLRRVEAEPQSPIDGGVRFARKGDMADSVRTWNHVNISARLDCDNYAK
jgi:hypothetical protein